MPLRRSCILPTPLLTTLLCAVTLLQPASGQTTKSAPRAQPSISAPKSTVHNTNPERPVPLALRPYLGCKLPIGPDLVQRTLLPEAPMARTAQTFSGPKKVQLQDGVMAAFAYPGEQPFTNVKVELLPATTYGAEKTDLISEFDKINAWVVKFRASWVASSEVRSA